jgi:hypothetical protein
MFPGYVTEVNNNKFLFPRRICDEYVQQADIRLQYAA